MKKSAHTKLLEKADRALQDWYRAKYPAKKCESCGAPFELMHHFVEKGRSGRLRFEKKNLIFICTKCHSLHHVFHDSSIMLKITARKGRKWAEELLAMKGEKGFQLTNEFLESMVEKYSRSK